MSYKQSTKTPAFTSQRNYTMINFVSLITCLLNCLTRRQNNFSKFNHFTYCTIIIPSFCNNNCTKMFFQVREIVHKPELTPSVTIIQFRIMITL